VGRLRVLFDELGRAIGETIAEAVTIRRGRRMQPFPGEKK
jgi:hypothetical protein